MSLTNRAQQESLWMISLYSINEIHGRYSKEAVSFITGAVKELRKIYTMYEPSSDCICYCRVFSERAAIDPRYRMKLL